MENVGNSRASLLHHFVSQDCQDLDKNDDLPFCSLALLLEFLSTRKDSARGRLDLRCRRFRFFSHDLSHAGHFDRRRASVLRPPARLIFRRHFSTIPRVVDRSRVAQAMRHVFTKPVRIALPWPRTTAFLLGLFVAVGLLGSHRHLDTIDPGVNIGWQAGQCPINCIDSTT